VPVDQYTIEHILPQNPNLSTASREALGPEWERVQQQCLHTLGNLTLTGYNTEYSDRPFVEKRYMKGGFRESPLRLNAGLGQLDTWNEAAIQQRAGRLADLALAVWPAPSLDALTLAAYQPKAVVLGGCTIDDHPYLLTAGLREVFEAFRKEVLALDPCVSEEFLKLYVAYKAETNFVDVVPQAKRLRLSLNMTFPEINDPNGLCKDVTALGRWGNGDVEVSLKSIDELPYVMGLVRQSYERQMGDGGQG
jgi:predicted transport protein